MFIEQCIFISTSLLKKQGFLSFQKTGTFSWTDGSRVTVSSNPGNLQLRVTYNCDGEQYDYIIRLMEQYIVLTDSYRYYLSCPVSHKNATTLYMCSGMFIHVSEALKRGVYYYNQTQSKRDSQIEAHHANKRKVDKFNKSPKAKCFHNGKPTKRYERIKKTESKSLLQLDSFWEPCKY